MANEFTRVMDAVLARTLPKKQETVALLFSGGVDSLCCGIAAELRGHKVHAYTFHVDGLPSDDSRAAPVMAKKLGWEFTPIDVPVANLKQDFLDLAYKWKCKTKPQFECTWPFLYVAPEIEEKYVLSGIAADCHFGLSRVAMVYYAHSPKAFDAYRRDAFSRFPNLSGHVQHRAVLARHGKKALLPFLEPEVFDYFIQLTWADINLPCQKYPLLTAYPEHFKLVGRRNHLNLQLAAKIDDVFATLLDTDLNVMRRKSMLHMYKDYVKMVP